MTKKQAAQEFLKLSAGGQSQEAFQQYVAETFIHHNAYFKGDRLTLMTAMEENARQNPDKVFEIKQVMEDGNLVAVHSHVRQTPDSSGAAVIHIFRFENNKIVELWDVAQAVPGQMINENGMF